MNNAQKFLDPDKENARQRLHHQLFPDFINEQSLMTPAERLTLIALLQRIQPKHAIELGTFKGGSLSVLSPYCDKIYSIDVEMAAKEQLSSRFKNVEFITANSDHCLAPLLARLQREQADLSFILMDGDHSFAGVSSEINSLLSYRPRCPLHVLIHDSFNPPCRRAILEADWASSPYVHFVEIDFVPGNLWKVSNHGHHQMWNGFALVILQPDPRAEKLSVLCTAEWLFQKAFPQG